MTNPSWGVKRNCPSCAAHFYDLNKMPAHCPKCEHTFDPTLPAKAKRKATKRGAPEEKKVEITATILAAKRKVAAKKKDKSVDGEAGDDIVEMEEDDMESLQEISELGEREDPQPGSEDDADEEGIIEKLDTGKKALVEDVEEEEAKALREEIEEEEESSSKKKIVKPKKKSK